MDNNQFILSLENKIITINKAGVGLMIQYRLY